MRYSGVFLAIVTSALILPCAARADIIFYTLPGSRTTFMLQGSATFNPGGTLTFHHPKFGRIYFSTRETEVRKAPTIESRFNKELGRAGNDPAKLTEAAQWALRRGLLPQFYETVDKLRAADPQNLRALMVSKLKQQIELPIADSPQQEKELRDLVGRSEMKIIKSKHFLLLHDTPDKPYPNRRLSRAEERVQLLEQVYESFLLRFYANGVELELPRERLKVVLFQEHKDYHFFATKLSPDLASASGFWSPTSNTSVFFDNGTTANFKELSALSKQLQGVKKEAQRIRAANAADIVRLADTIAVLIEIDRENSDIGVVSHETTHQMAANTGLLPRHVMIPSWVHEGLATYFEAPNGAAWGGIGAVNEQRLEWYRALESDRVHSNIDFIVGDQIFDFAASHGSTLHGYAQAWALTHFLLEKRFDQFMAFYRRLGEMPPEVRLSADVLTELFNETVTKDHAILDSEWRTYMRSLKTDLEVILE